MALNPEELLAAVEQPQALLIDVREAEEYQQGHLPGAELIPQTELITELQRRSAGDAERLVLYCAVGQRSARAGEKLLAAGYQHVAHLDGGLESWLASGRELVYPAGPEGQAQRPLSTKQRQRYSRQLLLPEIGVAGQAKLLNSRVLLIGAGGLGSPAALYLAAAGVGTLGLVDDDLVEESNLQRQILHRQAAVGQLKTASGRATLQALNPEVVVNEYPFRLSAENAPEIIADYDLLIDGSDNFPTRYLLNDLALAAGKPLISAAILGFAGQLTTIIPGAGPCYRCLYRQPPPAELAPSCATNGILGVVAGLLGVLQANEAIKVLLDVGEPLSGQLLLVEALENEFQKLHFATDPECPSCSPGAQPGSWSAADYQQFCAVG